MFLSSFCHFLIPIEFPFCSSITSRCITNIYIFGWHKLNVIQSFPRSKFTWTKHTYLQLARRISVRISIFWLLTSSPSASARIISSLFNGVGVWYPFTFFDSSMQTVKMIFVSLFRLIVVFTPHQFETVAGPILTLSRRWLCQAFITVVDYKNNLFCLLDSESFWSRVVLLPAFVVAATFYHLCLTE